MSRKCSGSCGYRGVTSRPVHVSRGERTAAPDPSDAADVRGLGHRQRLPGRPSLSEAGARRAARCGARLGSWRRPRVRDRCTRHPGALGRGDRRVAGPAATRASAAAAKRDREEGSPRHAGAADLRSARGVPNASDQPRLRTAGRPGPACDRRDERDRAGGEVDDGCEPGARRGSRRSTRSAWSTSTCARRASTASSSYRTRCSNHHVPGGSPTSRSVTSSSPRRCVALTWPWAGSR